MPNPRDVGPEMANDIVWLLRLRTFLTSLLSFMDANSTMHLPEIDQEIEVLIQSMETIEQSGTNSEDSRIIMENLRTASRLARNIFDTLQGASQYAKSNLRCIAAGTTIMGAVCGIGAQVKIGFAAGAVAAEAATGAAATGAAATGAAATGAAVAASWTSTLFVLASAGGVGALVGAILIVVPYNIYAKRIDFQARIRYMRLTAELIRSSAIATQLYVCVQDHEILQFINETEEFIRMINAHV